MTCADGTADGERAPDADDDRLETFLDLRAIDG
jgi:hypothetical protein